YRARACLPRRTAAPERIPESPPLSHRVARCRVPPTYAGATRGRPDRAGARALGCTVPRVRGPVRCPSAARLWRQTTPRCPVQRQGRAGRSAELRRAVRVLDTAHPYAGTTLP